VRDGAGKIIFRREHHRNADGSEIVVVRDGNGAIIGREYQSR
jgi:hypothetical protein